MTDGQHQFGGEPTGPALVIGLTGGIGSGKSAVSRMFEELTVPVVDADVVAREMVVKGSDGLREIVDAFGAQVLRDDGELDRRALRERIFADQTAKQTLESILHPKIRATLFERVSQTQGAYAILAVPLLLESRDTYTMVDRVAVVDVTEEEQITRTMSRDDTTRDAVERIIAAQMNRADRLALADDVIDNSGSIEETRRIVLALHERYLALAVAKTAP